MPNQILLDNWTLQEISYLGKSGLSNDQTDKLVVDQENDSHFFEKISSGLIQLQALFSFLQNLVLRETIITDSRFVQVWDDSNSLKRIQFDGLIKVHDFQEENLKDMSTGLNGFLKDQMKIQSLAMASDTNVLGIWAVSMLTRNM